MVCCGAERPISARTKRTIKNRRVESYPTQPAKEDTAVKPVPDGYHTATPYLIVEDSARAIDFYQRAFGAMELMRLPGPDGKIGHAEIKIGDSPIMLADEFPDMGARSPRSFGGSPVSIHLYLEDVDAVVNRAVDAGAKLVRPVEDKFYGDRMGSLEDSYGHHWHIATHKEDLSPEEIRKGAEAASKEQST